MLFDRLRLDVAGLRLDVAGRRQFVRELRRDRMCGPRLEKVKKKTLATLRVARVPMGRDPTRAERVGLTARFTEAEALAKYGSVAAARLAVRLR